MTGFQLFEHAVRRVFQNFYEALAVSGVIWIVLLILQIIMFETVDMDAIAEGRADAVDGRALWYIFLLNVVIAVGSCWIAVEWHRFALEGKRPVSAIPEWNGSRIMAYLGTAILIGLLIGLFFAMVVGFLGALIGSAFASLGGLFVIVVVGLPAIYGFFRVSPVLPAAALGQKLRFGEAWNMTSAIGGPIMQAAILMIALMMVVQLPGLAMGEGLIAVLYELAAGWVMLMVNVSLLSSIYELATGGQLNGE